MYVTVEDNASFMLYKSQIKGKKPEKWANESKCVINESDFPVLLNTQWNETRLRKYWNGKVYFLFVFAIRWRRSGSEVKRWVWDDKSLISLYLHLDVLKHDIFWSQSIAKVLQTEATVWQLIMLNIWLHISCLQKPHEAVTLTRTSTPLEWSESLHFPSQRRDGLCWESFTAVKNTKT